MTPNVTIDHMVSRWTSLGRPLFGGKLIDNDGCKCAQGDVLFCAGYTDEQLRKMTQTNADTETARILGISRTHAVLLRQVNDTVGGAPQLVLSHPEEVLGAKAHILLAFWLYLDRLSAAARDAAWDAAAAGDAAAARDAAAAAAWAAARDAAAAGDAARAAAWASSEIQGMDLLEQQGRKPYFLAFCGLDTWDKVRALVRS